MRHNMPCIFFLCLAASYKSRMPHFSCTYSVRTVTGWTHFIKHCALKAYGGGEVELREFLISIPKKKTNGQLHASCHLTSHEDPCVAILDTGLMVQEMLQSWGSDVQTKILRLHSRIRLSRPLYGNKNRPKLNAPLRTHWRSSNCGVTGQRGLWLRVFRVFQFYL